MDRDSGRPRPTPSQFVASVVVPAHNESAVIGRLLSSLEAQDYAQRIDLVVVANGCADDTADVARSFASSFPGLSVLELATAGKVDALRAGDEQARTATRIYVDSDIVFAPGALDRLVDALTVDRPCVGAPRIVFDIDDASASVRGFYRVFGELPYVRSSLVGLGVYGLSATGRERFDAFPELTADDMFVQRLFAPSERIESDGTFTVRTPATIGALIKVRTRSAAGYRQLNQFTDSTDLPMHVDRSSDDTASALVRMVRRRPSRISDVAIYVVVTVISRIRSRGYNPATWHRDETSRR